jgi:multidrug resistance protein MdtO
MATLAPSVPDRRGPWHWFWEFLKEELAPYPGRAQTVARMVLAATIVMIICVTFRIPYAFQGATYALFITRESPRATLESARTIILVSVVSVIYVFVSAYFVISVPVLHFLWNVGSFFLAFYALSAMTNYGGSVIFAIVIAVAVPIWDRHLSAETNVEDTLRLALAGFVGAAVTTAVELACRRMRPGDDIVLPTAKRLNAVHSLLVCYAEGRSADDATEKTLIRLGTLGTSMLRRLLRRSDYSPEYRTQMAGVVALVGRLVDIAASLTSLSFRASDAERMRFRSLAAAVAGVYSDLVNRRIPSPIQFDIADDVAGSVPLLREMETTVELIPQAFAGSQSMDEFLGLSGDVPPSKLLAADAFSNSAHFRFALKGCFAAGLCYVIYNLIDWPGISTAVTTCLLTALSTIGSSRQKQILRFAGALVGGVIVGMGSQIFILPYVDTIVGFTVLFILVTAVSSWVMTSSPRLSYFGLQVAFAFYLINLQEFAFQTSLSIARDRIVGVLMGLFAMWFVFDRLWGKTAAVEMKRAFISNLRLIAQFAREPLSKDLSIAIDRSFSLRDTINDGLDQVRALADGVLFEFGPSRQQDLALRGQIVRWQPQLRMIFVTRIALWKYRAQLPGFELPKPITGAQEEFDESLAMMLDGVADQMEGRTPVTGKDFEHSADRLSQTIQACCLEKPEEPLGSHLATFISLSRKIQTLTISLDKEVTERQSWPA